MRPILVVGAPRSGTTLTAQVLEACGVDFGPGLDKYHERKSLKAGTRRILGAAGFDPYGLGSLPAEPLDGDLGCVSFHGFKDPKTLLCLKAWQRAVPNAIWVKVRRDRRDIEASFRRVGWPVEAIDTYLRFLGMVEGIEVWPPHLHGLVRQLGLPWRADGLFDRSLWRGAR